MNYTKLVALAIIISGIILILASPIYRHISKSQKDNTVQLIQETELSVTNSVSGVTSTIDYIVEFDYKGHTYLKFGNGDNITHAGHCRACKHP